MEEIIVKSNTNDIIENPFSIIDEEYSLDITTFNVLDISNQTKNDICNKLESMLLKVPSAVGINNSVDDDKLVAVLSENAQTLIREGKATLNMSKDKRGLLPVLTDKKGKYIEQVRLKKENLTPELIQNMNSLAVQAQLQQIVEQIEDISDGLKTIEAGQRNDRFGTLEAAKRQYLEALECNDIEKKNRLIEHAVVLGNQASEQLIATFKSDIIELTEAKSKKNRDKFMLELKRSMRGINEAKQVCALGYLAIGEEKAMLISLQSYADFIETEIVAKRIGTGTVEQLLHSYDANANSQWMVFPKKIQKSINQIQILPSKNLSSNMLVEAVTTDEEM